MSVRYKLPDLPYDHGALEPHLSGKILELHHGKHHKAYVDNANRALDALEEARDGNDAQRIAALDVALAFNVSGHVLHSIYWRNMAPGAGGEPTGALKDAIERDFGGFTTMKRLMIHTASTIMGSGWSVLAFEPARGGLVVVQVHDHQSNVTQGSIPLLVLDVWEHAYYLQYQTDKAKFFEASFHLWNWNDVAERFEAAQRTDLVIPNAREASERLAA